MGLDNFPDSIDDLMLDPHKVGMPTFEEFKRNPDMWRKPKDEVLALADNGSKLLSRSIDKTFYDVDGYRCKTPEEAEKVALSQGYSLDSLEFRPFFEPGVAGKGNLIIALRLKKNVKAE